MQKVCVNGVNEIIQHVIPFTLFGTIVIIGTSHYDFVTGQAGAPHEILSMATECDGTPLAKRGTGQYGVGRWSVIPATLDDGKSQGKRRH